MSSLEGSLTIQKRNIIYQFNYSLERHLTNITKIEMIKIEEEVTYMGEKVAIVTGGASGLGKYIAKDLLESGLRVVITDINEKQLKKTKTELNKSNQSAEQLLTIPMDVSSVDEIKETVNTILDKWNRIDILVNNAGIREETSVKEITEEEWNKIIGVNLTGTFFFSQAVINTMEKQGWGRIINISSYGGQAGPLSSGAHYCASKAGQLVITKSFARSCADNGITVNSVAPAAIRTPEMDRVDPGKLETMKNTIPVKRFGESEEVGKLVKYLVSEDTGYITGATFDINGGIFMR